MDRIRLLHGNCLDLMQSLPDHSIDCILTDPPYGTTACPWDSVISFDDMWKQLKRLIKPNGAICLFGTEPFASTLRLSNIKWYKYDWTYVKAQAQNFLNAKKQPLRNSECISVFYRKQCTYNPQMTEGKPYSITSSKQSKSVSADENVTKGGYTTVNTGERYPLTVMQRYNPETGLHPTQKPVPLMEYLIKTYTDPDETVLDFTMGSGSTGVACVNTDRKFIGIELDDEYYMRAVQRIQTALSKGE